MINKILQRAPTNEKEFFLAYRYWYRKLYYFLYQKTQCSNLAEDVVQQTFLIVWERKNNANQQIQFSTQLFQIARTKLIDELRRRALNRKYVEFEKPFVLTQYEDLERQIAYKGELEYVKELITQMPFMRQQVFYLHKIEELSYKEIAVKLSISPKTVENHVSIGLKFIKKFFKLS
ncbi:MAG: sigma-70 family RNA polymerase sigma factor [Sphingobacterium sp.]|jgi:RNA polymerase sigma-70 factor (ECF subfamily)|uniref:RNA polymerase sigma factor n=1 Tax=unclassified Sphingobacterium TaxID=2609468 RepID=UPI00284133BB|nr:sigma-70 family RNA polymerase sigma factor [Sphingobacterium sp.]MDR3009585.1 sigma-70 family RNA polymerase sigma factor [Sphingobacterium sp.]